VRVHAAVLCLTVQLVVGAAVASDPWQTRAEASDFAATSTLAETVDFLHRLADRNPALRVTSFGRSGQGRELPLVVASAKGAFTPAAARAGGGPVVLLLAGIHPGEVDGKDALLLMLRDLALGRRPDLLGDTTLVIVPVYNADGHERISPFNRPNQDGPALGMGFRANAAGLDLNRDFVKLDAPESRALVRLVNAWRPHLVVDNHVTDGCDHTWIVTWAASEQPQVARELGAWLGAAMARATAVTAAAGHPNGPYVDLLDRLDPTRGFSSVVADARYSTGYFPLRNRPVVLVENHSLKPFRQRVEGNRAFLEALLGEVRRSGRELVAAVAAAERATVDRGRPDAEPSEVVLEWRPAAPDRATLPLREWWLEESPVTGLPLLRFRPDTSSPVEVPWQHRVEPERTVPRPRGYLVLPGWPQIEERLAGHGLRVERLASPARLEVESTRLTEPRYAPTSYQGRTRVEATVVRGLESRDLPAGTVWVPADQPDFELAAQLLEPEAPDSLLRWGLLSSVFELKEYIGTATLEREARALLEADPSLRAEWEQALSDPAFAADPLRRHLWWYRRSPQWDETVGLLPVFRLLTPLDAKTEPYLP